MDAHFAVSFQIQNLRHPHPRKVPGSTQKWQEGIGVALTISSTGRRIWPSGFKKFIVEKLDAGELTVLQVEREGQVARSLIYKWQARIGAEEAADRPTNPFAQVRVEDASMGGAPPARSPSSLDIRCIHVHGAVSNLILPADYPIENLIQLVRAMEGPTC